MKIKTLVSSIISIISVLGFAMPNASDADSRQI